VLSKDNDDGFLDLGSIDKEINRRTTTRGTRATRTNSTLNFTVSRKSLTKSSWFGSSSANNDKRYASLLNDIKEGDEKKNMLSDQFQENTKKMGDMAKELGTKGKALLSVNEVESDPDDD